MTNEADTDGVVDEVCDAELTVEVQSETLQELADATWNRLGAE